MPCIIRRQVVNILKKEESWFAEKMSQERKEKTHVKVAQPQSQGPRKK
jgi:hypothetical protein